MALFKDSRPSLPTSSEAVENRYIRRPIKGFGEQLRDSLTHRDTVMMIMVGTGLLTLILPALFLLLVPSSLTYYLWASRQKYRLPFKTPINWGGTDYGAPKPGGRGRFGKAAGILYFGQDEAGLEELWIENGDARRHGFFIGTTGSGKALPLDTPVLTPNGWVLNGDIRPGDEVSHPDGGSSRVLSVHPQGAIRAVRLLFADGREAVCSEDHLWHVRATSKPGLTCPQALPEEGRVMEARDIGILFGLYGADLDMTVPLSAPFTGPAAGDRLSEAEADRAARDGLDTLPVMPSVIGTPEERSLFLDRFIRRRGLETRIDPQGVRLLGVRPGEARLLKEIAWSLGGFATAYLTPEGRTDVTLLYRGIERAFPDAAGCVRPHETGLPIVGVEPVDGLTPMSCIKVDREDGLYVMEGHVTTHNTELLLGVVSQTLMWSSGFLFIDGKGTTEFYARAWTLCKRFGREDDLRVLNFTDPGGDPDAPAGGPSTQSNTLNPFSKGSPDQLMNIVVSLMGDAGSGNDMWKSRAISLVTAQMMALCELRDSGEILLNVQTVRDFLALGKGVDKAKLRGKKPTKVEEIPKEAWDEMRTRAGLIELYLRAMKGELSQTTLLALRGFFDTLPGFSLEKAMAGDPQETKCNEQYGFLSMQLTKPLGSLADGYGHIFRTPLGEIDMDDVVLNRRILVVLLPALQKAPEEMQNCGKIVVTLAKIMMGNAAGFELQGTRQEIVEAKQTRAPSPYIVVLDEAGYYMVPGIDVMMAQARSLGFMIIVAGQDMAAMQKTSPQIAETAAANASILAVGKTVDGDKTISFVQRLIGKSTVSVSSGFQSQPGVLGNRWVDRMDATFQEVDKVRIDELQSLGEGQFYFLFNGKLIRAATFFIGDEFGENFSVNKFLKVRGPTDKVPGLDQSVDNSFVQGLIDITAAMAGGLKRPVIELDDALALALSVSAQFRDRAGPAGGAEAQRMGDLVGIAATLGTAPQRDPEPDGWSDLIEGGETPDLDDIRRIAGLRREAVLPEVPERDRTPSRDRPVAPPPQRDPPVRPDPAGRVTPPARPAVPEQPPRAPAPKPDNPLPDEIIPSRITDSILMATRGGSPAERHHGLLGMFDFEDQVRREAATSGFIPDVRAELAATKKTETVAAMFGTISRHMERMQQLLISEVADGDLAAQIMERAAPMRPTILPHEAGEDEVRSRMAGLEQTLEKSLRGSA
jgi:hypothetical protein